jgi:hypothetical protein
VLTGNCVAVLTFGGFMNWTIEIQTRPSDLNILVVTVNFIVVFEQIVIRNAFTSKQN